MKEIFRMSVLFFIMFLVSIFFIASFREVAAFGQATIPPTHSGFIDRHGLYRVVGEVENIGDRNIRYPEVNATFYDVNNTVIASSSSYSIVMLDVLLPGRKAPFEIVLGNKIESALVHNYSLSTVYEEYPLEKPSLLQIMQSTTYSDEAGFQRVNGTVTNLATSNATYVKVAATFYNAQGKVVGVTYGYTTPSTIMPGHAERFDIELRHKASDFSSYSLTAESVEYAAVSREATTLSVSLTLNATIVNSGANVSVQVHVTNGTMPVKDASVQLMSDKGGIFVPQSGYTNSDGNLTATFTAPTVSAQTSITITANATKTGFILGKSQKQITVNPILQPDLTLWIYFGALALVAAFLGGSVAIARRKRQKAKTRARSRIKKPRLLQPCFSKFLCFLFLFPRHHPAPEISV